jgi:hypothetical protein
VPRLWLTDPLVSSRGSFVIVYSTISVFLWSKNIATIQEWRD